MQPLDGGACRIFFLIAETGYKDKPFLTIFNAAAGIG
jgi:hypothetical protein